MAIKSISFVLPVRYADQEVTKANICNPDFTVYISVI